MNYRSGILHGDLHLNNATLRPSLYKTTRDIGDLKNPTVLYVLGGKKFLLPTVSYNTCVIDFSRCIILPDKIEYLHDKSLPKSYSIINNMKEFHKNQVELLLKLYLHYTSDSDHNKDELRIIFRNKFEAVFKLVSSTDIYGFTQKLLMVFKLDEKNVVKPNSACIDLLQKINKQARKFLIEEMNNLISDTSYEDVVLQMEWPIYTIIKKCFGEYELTDTTPLGDMIDVFNIDNELKYSLIKYDKFPDPIAKPKSVVNGKVTDLSIKPDIKVHFKSRKNYETEKANGLKVVNYIATRQREKHF